MWARVAAISDSVLIQGDSMQSVHFTMEDLAQLRVLPTVGPVAEAVFAVDLFRRGGGGPSFTRWRDAVSLRMRRMQPGPVAPRVPRPAGPPASQEGTGGGSWLFDLLAQEQEGVSGDAEHPPDPVVRRMLQLGVAPYWGKARGYLQIDRDYRCRV